MMRLAVSNWQKINTSKLKNFLKIMIEQIAGGTSSALKPLIQKKAP